jgi:hypothetical protein
MGKGKEVRKIPWEEEKEASETSALRWEGHIWVGMVGGTAGKGKGQE